MTYIKKHLPFAFILLLSLSLQGQQQLGYYIQFEEENPALCTQTLPLIESFDGVANAQCLTGLNGMLIETKIHSISTLSEKLEGLAIDFIHPVVGDGNGHICTDLGEVFIKLNQMDSLPYLNKWMGEMGFEAKAPLQHREDIRIYRYTDKTEHHIKTIKAFSASTGFIDYVSVNQLYTPNLNTNDPHYFRQWNMQNAGTPTQYNGTAGADMDMVLAWSMTKGNPAIKVAILDSGVDTNHADLQGILLPGYDATGNNTKGFPSLDHSGDAHGTACAGIIGAQHDNNIGIAGIAPKCKIIPVRIFEYIAFGGQVIPYTTAERGATGLLWATFDASADVLSNSWGILDSIIPLLNLDTVFSNDVIRDVIGRGRNYKGLPAFFSSGNEGTGTALWPSRIKETIAIGATTMCDELKTSNDCSPENWGGDHGNGLDFSAPGVLIATTDITGNDGYNFADYTLSFNGTSAACPHAAGLAALMLSVDPNLTTAQVRRLMALGAEKVGGYNYDSTNSRGSWSFELGHGRINAYLSLQEVFIQVGLPAENYADAGFVLHGNGSANPILYRANMGNTKQQLYHLEIYNTNGQLVFRQAAITENDLKGGIDIINTIGKNIHGLYLLNLKNENTNTSLKLSIL